MAFYALSTHTYTQNLVPLSLFTIRICRKLESGIQQWTTVSLDDIPSWRCIDGAKAVATRAQEDPLTFLPESEQLVVLSDCEYRGRVLEGGGQLSHAIMLLHHRNQISLQLEIVPKTDWDDGVLPVVSTASWRKL